MRNINSIVLFQQNNIIQQKKEVNATQRNFEIKFYYIIYVFFCAILLQLLRSYSTEFSSSFLHFQKNVFFLLASNQFRFFFFSLLFIFFSYLRTTIDFFSFFSFSLFPFLSQHITRVEMSVRGEGNLYPFALMCVNKLLCFCTNQAR